jgi:hypothetical protein
MVPLVAQRRLAPKPSWPHDVTEVTTKPALRIDWNSM